MCPSFTRCPLRTWEEPAVVLSAPPFPSWPQFPTCNTKGIPLTQGLCSSDTVTTSQCRSGTTTALHHLGRSRRRAAGKGFVDCSGNWAACLRPAHSSQGGVRRWKVLPPHLSDVETNPGGKGMDQAVPGETRPRCQAPPAPCFFVLLYVTARCLQESQRTAEST